MTLRNQLLCAAYLSGAIVLTAPDAVEAQAVRVGVGVGVAVPRAAVVVRGPRYRPVAVYGSGWGYYPWISPYAYPYPNPYFYAQYPYYRYDNSGSLRLQVTPKQTEVFVDGYFAGTVDDFDGVMQRLHIEPGDHEIQLFLPGHRIHTQRIYLQPHKTFRIRHDMVALGAGEAEPARPTGDPLPRRYEDDEDERRDDGRRPPAPRDREPRPDRSAPPAASRGDADFGSLALRVQPADAEVMIDGDKWQGAPGERLVVELSAGPHRVEIRKEGYRTYLTEITVRPGQTATLNVAMTRAN